MADLNRSRLLVVLVTVLTFAVAYQAYELDSMRRDLSEATTILRAMSGGQSLPLARTESNARPASPEATPKADSPAAPASPSATVQAAERVKSPVRAGQLPPTVDKTYTPKVTRVIDPKDPCRSGCQLAMQCALRNDRCPGIDTKNEATFLPACLSACRQDNALRAHLTGKTVCVDGLSALRAQVPAMDAACTHKK